MRKRSAAISVGLFSALLSLGLHSGRSAQIRSGLTDIRMNDLTQWVFEGGYWSETAQGDIHPPSEYQDYYTAFYQPKAYANLEASFQVRLENGVADPGMILHARDARHYYLVHFPTVGQQWRAKHFWVAISRVNEGGYKHVLKLAMVPQLDSNLFVWHQVRIMLKGEELHVWVDGHFAAEAGDRGLSEPGQVGVAGFGLGHSDAAGGGKFTFRALKIQGEESAPHSWPADVHPVKNWFQPCPDATYGKWQLPPSIIRTPKGDLLMAFQARAFAGPGRTTPTEFVMTRSTDSGQHWSKPEPPQVTWPEELAKGGEDRQGTLFITPDHRVMFQDIATSGEQGSRVYIAESRDDGLTWSDVRRAKMLGEWPKDPGILYPYGSIILLQDGTSLTTVQGSTLSSAMEYYEFDWGAPRSQAFSIRSTDGGYSWSAPVDLDGSPAIPLADKPRSTNLDLTEANCVQMKNRTVQCFVRPNNSPFMWVTESKDSGQTWGPTTFGSFPGYAANAFYTDEGATLVAHRLPDLAINTSRDEGLNWDQGTIVGTDLWAMGDMVQVAPNVVLFVYMDTQQGFLRAQFIRIGADGLEPAVEMLPKQ